MAVGLAWLEERGDAPAATTSFAPSPASSSGNRREGDLDAAFEHAPRGDGERAALADAPAPTRRADALVI